MAGSTVYRRTRVASVLTWTALAVAALCVVVAVLLAARLHPDRGWDWVLSCAGPSVAAFGAFALVLGNTAKSRAAEAELERFRAALNRSADAVFLIDRRKMRFVDVNQTACDGLGYSRERLLDLGPHDIKPHHSRESLAEEFDRVIASGKPGTIRTEHQRRDGSRFAVEVFLHSWEAPEGPQLVAVARDTTERDRADREIRRHRATLQGMNLLLEQTIVCETDEQVARSGLQVAMDLTGSTCGWIGELNERETIDTIALEVPEDARCAVGPAHVPPAMPDFFQSIKLKALYTNRLRVIWFWSFWLRLDADSEQA